MAYPNPALLRTRTNPSISFACKSIYCSYEASLIPNSYAGQNMPILIGLPVSAQSVKPRPLQGFDRVLAKRSHRQWDNISLRSIENTWCARLPTGIHTLRPHKQVQLKNQWRSNRQLLHSYGDFDSCNERQRHAMQCARLKSLKTGQVYLRSL